MNLTADEQAALAEARSHTSTTLRPTVPAMEERLLLPVPVLDHGFVRVIDYMGDDGAIVQAARVSYGRGTRTAHGDRGLIRYLMRHRHTSPFEMCELKLHCKMPIFVARQWVRHRTASLNEISARYSVLDREFYLPAPEHLAVQATDNKQGRAEALAPQDAATVLEILKRDALRSYGTYEQLMEDHDLARELARMNLTLGMYTQWYWKIDLHNLLHFLSLRMDRHAQYEIRVFADAIGEVVEQWVPHTWEAFSDYRLGGMFLSRQEVQILRRRLRGETVSADDAGLSGRELGELIDKFEGDLGVDMPPRKS